MIIIEKKEFKSELLEKNTLIDLQAFVNENKLADYDAVRIGVEFKFAPDTKAEELFNPFNIEDVNVENLNDIVKIREKQKEAKNEYLNSVNERAATKASTSYLESIGIVITVDDKARMMLLLKNDDEKVIIEMFTYLLNTLTVKRVYTCGPNGTNVIQFLQRCIVNDAYFANDTVRQMIKAKSNANVLTNEDTQALNIIDLMSVWSFNAEKHSDRLSVLLSIFTIKIYELGHKYLKISESETKTKNIYFEDELDIDKPICTLDLLDIPEEDLLTLNAEDYKYYLEYKLHCMQILSLKFFGIVL